MAIRISRLFEILFVLFTVQSACAQEPVRWSFAFNEQEQVLEMTADIDQGWHLYSQNLSVEFGPVPTVFYFQKAAGVRMVGETLEPVPKVGYDPVFGGDLHFFDEHVVFKQNVEVKRRAIVKGSVTFMTCNERQCLPPVEKEFEITVHTNTIE